MERRFLLSPGTAPVIFRLPDRRSPCVMSSSPELSSGCLSSDQLVDDSTILFGDVFKRLDGAGLTGNTGAGATCARQCPEHSVWGILIAARRVSANDQLITYLSKID